MPIVPDVRDVVGAVVGLVDAREMSEGRVAESLGSGDVAGGTAARLEEIGVGEDVHVRHVEGRNVQDGGCEVEYGAVVRGENG